MPPRTGTPRPHCTNQLTLPLRGRRVAAAPEPEPDLPPRPSDEQLRGILFALVEVADGRRSPETLRERLAKLLYRRLRQRPPTPLGRRFFIRRVHAAEQQRGVLEVCATVAVPRQRSFAVVARVEAQWHGWLFTDFAVVLPADGAAGRAAA